MKGSLLIAGVLVMMTLPVQAGQLIIRETETEIIVEYIGDPTGTEGNIPLEKQPAFKKLAQLTARPEVPADATNIKDTISEAKIKAFEAAKKQANALKAQKWSGKTASEKYD